MNPLTEQEKEELKKLTGIKTYPGLLSTLSGFGIVLALIGVFCPFFSYNPTIVDDLKRTVGFLELPFLAMVGLLFLFIALFLSIFESAWVTKYIKEPKAKNYGRNMIIHSVVTVIFALLSLILVQISALFYKIPESSFETLPLKDDAGSVLYYTGVILFCIADLAKSILLKSAMTGKTDIDKLAIGKQSDTKKDEGQTLQQLSEWKKLLDEGVITQEEYDAKKTELLKKQ